MNILQETISPKRDSDFDQPDGQKPGPSRASVRILEGGDEDLSEPSDTVQAGLWIIIVFLSENKVKKTESEFTERSFLSTVIAYISGFMVSVTLLLYKMSRNYRYVTKVLAKEKKDLKVSFF